MSGSPGRVSWGLEEQVWRPSYRARVASRQLERRGDILCHCSCRRRSLVIDVGLWSRRRRGPYPCSSWRCPPSSSRWVLAGQWDPMSSWRGLACRRLSRRPEMVEGAPSSDCPGFSIGGGRKTSVVSDKGPSSSLTLEVGAVVAFSSDTSATDIGGRGRGAPEASKISGDCDSGGEGRCAVGLGFRVCSGDVAIEDSIGGWKRMASRKSGGRSPVDRMASREGRGGRCPRGICERMARR